jgi:acylphosphatase
MVPETVARRVLVDGRVQGVGFRQACAEVARRRGLGGWVRNRRDGRVEALFEGPAADVAYLLDWCRRGPIMASVTQVQVTEETPAGLTVFRIASTG